MKHKPVTIMKQAQSEEFVSFRRDFTTSIVRAAIAHGHTRINKNLTATQHAERIWPNDKDVQLVLRASTSPIDMISGAALIQVAVAILPILTPFSAAAALFARALHVTLGRNAGGIIVPNVGTVGVTFVGPGVPKPVLQGTTSGARIDPFEMAGIAVVSSELFEQSSVEAVIQQMLGESAGPALDAVVFSNVAGSTSHPPGLLNGISALTAAAAGSDAFISDVKALAAAVGPVAGNGGVIYIGSPGQVESARHRTFSDRLDYWIASSIVPAGTVIAVAVNAIVSSVTPPAFETSTQATLQMDSAPSTLLAAPTSSMWQTASVATRMTYGVSWALRSSQGVAWTQNVNW